MTPLVCSSRCQLIALFHFLLIKCVLLSKARCRILSFNHTLFHSGQHFNLSHSLHISVPSVSAWAGLNQVDILSGKRVTSPFSRPGASWWKGGRKIDRDEKGRDLHHSSVIISVGSPFLQHGRALLEFSPLTSQDSIIVPPLLACPDNLLPNISPKYRALALWGAPEFTWRSSTLLNISFC